MAISTNQKPTIYRYIVTCTRMVARLYPLPADHDYCRFYHVLLLGQITDIVDKMRV